MRSCIFFIPLPSWYGIIQLVQVVAILRLARYFIIAHCSLRLGGTILVGYGGVDSKFLQTPAIPLCEHVADKKAPIQRWKFRCCPPTRIWPMAGVRCVTVGLCRCEDISLHGMSCAIPDKRMNLLSELSWNVSAIQLRYLVRLKWWPSTTLSFLSQPEVKERERAIGADLCIWR